MAFDESCSKGLTQEEVESRRQRGLINGTDEIKTKSVKQIILNNLVTPFNILNVALAALIVMVGSYKNLLFMGVIICNTLIGTIQEIRAKKTIDRLKLIAAPKAGVMRDGVKQELPVEDLVLDDILILTSGNQVCADCMVVDGECEVNESLITGEQDPILKKDGDHLLSGSFIASGNCCA
ncbi:MAG: HAD-IC family P-type ATPase, partial [Clostridiales bacterium]|nr:HAD-IC family P-type ATPase [Clostridiales bacterium]